MIFTVYKTINLLNEKYYLGVHKTDNPEDYYLGSGHIIQASVKKYGRENFRKEILFIFETAQEAYNKEKELIKEHKLNSKCMNLADGGEGSRYGKTPFLTEKRLAALRRNSKLTAGKPRPNHWTKNPQRNTKNFGPKFSDESKEKMRRAALARCTPEWSTKQAALMRAAKNQEYLNG